MLKMERETVMGSPRASLTSRGKSSGCTEWVPARNVYMLMGCLAFYCAYTMRTCMTVAITAMAEAASEEYDDDTCTSASSSSSTSSDTSYEFDWSEFEQQLILGAFYVGYVLSQIPAGILSDRRGGKYFLLCGLGARSVFSMLIPTAARHGGVPWVIVVRIMEGLGEGMTFPAASALMSHWAPPSERSRFGSVIFTGNILGQVVGNALTGVLTDATGDWANVFYFFGGCGLLWCVAFYFLCFNTPDDHPRISEAERTYINSSIAETKALMRTEHTPWFAILTSGAFWAVITAQFGHDWVLFTTGTELPKFMKTVLKYDLSDDGLVSALPNVSTYISSILCGWLSDWLVGTKGFSINVHRKLFVTIATGVPTFFIMGACYAGCSRVLVVSLFTIGMFTLGPFSSSLKVNPIDIGPNFAGLIMGFACSIGAISGILSPYIVGEIVYTGNISEWRAVFWVTFGICWATNVIFVVFGSTKVQPWNDGVDRKPCFDLGKLEGQAKRTQSSNRPSR